MDYYYPSTYDYYDYWYIPTDSSLLTVLFAILGAFLGIIIVVTIVIAILNITGMWKVFTKAGEKGWKSIIPIYNVVTLFKISGLSPWLVLVYLAAVIPFVGWIASLVLTIFQANGLAKSFGKDAGYTVGLIFLAPIFYLILAFGKSEYIGTKAEV